MIRRLVVFVVAFVSLSALGWAAPTQPAGKPFLPSDFAENWNANGSAPSLAALACDSQKPLSGAETITPRCVGGSLASIELKAGATTIASVLAALPLTDADRTRLDANSIAEANYPSTPAEAVNVTYLRAKASTVEVTFELQPTAFARPSVVTTSTNSTANGNAGAARNQLEPTGTASGDGTAQTIIFSVIGGVLVLLIGWCGKQGLAWLSKRGRPTPQPSSNTMSSTPTATP